jgi:hypothetical protein
MLVAREWRVERARVGSLGWRFENFKVGVRQKAAIKAACRQGELFRRMAMSSVTGRVPTRIEGPPNVKL